MDPTRDFDLFSSDFWHKVAISGSDISLAPAELTPKALGPWLGVVFWLILLLVPLSGVQRTQPVTGASYVLFLAGSATVLGVLFCLPWIGRDLSVSTLALVTGATAIGAWRWRQGSPTASSTPSSTQEKGPTP